MQRLGLALHVSSNKNVVIKVEGSPRIGEVVVDENMKPVGKVFDIIGPASSPYATLKPTVKEPQKLVGKRLYVTP
ncbi:MAG: Gar1/Naf1 family protein [Candidatus Bathyarchaeia archaeon]